MTLLKGKLRSRNLSLYAQRKYNKDVHHPNSITKLLISHEKAVGSTSTVCQKGVKKKKNCQGLGYIFLVQVYLEGLDYDKIKIFGVQNLEKNRFLYFMYYKYWRNSAIFSNQMQKFGIRG